VRHSDTEDPPWKKFRRALQRTRTRWLITTCVAFLSLWWTMTTVQAADRDSSAWGQQKTVPVAVNDLEPGHIITNDDINFAKRPMIVLPSDSADSPVGRTVIRSIARDETVTERRLAGGGLSGSAALLEKNSVAFAIPIDPGTPVVKLGDYVTLFAPSDVTTTAIRGAGPSARVADRAVVVAVNEKSLMVGVDPRDASSVARALLSASVIVALTN
jgi:Flp pilus assembly protein CpaB